MKRQKTDLYTVNAFVLLMPFSSSNGAMLTCTAGTLCILSSSLDGINDAQLSCPVVAANETQKCSRRDDDDDRPVQWRQKSLKIVPYFLRNCRGTAKLVTLQLQMLNNLVPNHGVTEDA
jgi:hypothetical protein